MQRELFDNILSNILDGYPNVSDINITVGKPFQAENHGELNPVELNPPIIQLTPFQTELFAFYIISGNQKLIETLLQTGSCDCS